VRQLNSSTPIVLGTWAFTNATTAAWKSLLNGSSAVEAIVTGGGVCEEERCDGSVGYGGSPDENGESTLDALIMDGVTMDAGSVANLRNVKNAIALAHAVLKHTEHTLIVGSLATDFAVSMGFPLTNLSTPDSLRIWENWKNANCQPNYWKDVTPDPRQNCGPYRPNAPSTSSSVLPSGVKVKSNADLISSSSHDIHTHRDLKFVRHNKEEEEFNHDTLGLIAIDQFGHVAGGTTTNGMTHKIPGRVGDSPIIGSGAYADNNVGAAAATGDGDVMMRFLPSFLAVELMRSGSSPSAAASLAISRITAHYPQFSGAVIAVKMNGEFGAACHNIPPGSFPYTVMSRDFNQTQTLRVTCS